MNEALTKVRGYLKTLIKTNTEYLKTDPEFKEEIAVSTEAYRHVLDRIEYEEYMSEWRNRNKL